MGCGCAAAFARRALALLLLAVGCTSPLIVAADAGSDVPSATGTGGAGGGSGGNGGSAGAGGAGGIVATGGTGGSATGGSGGAGGVDAGRDVGVDVGLDLRQIDEGGIFPTPSAAGQLVVTELMHDTDVVGDDFGEWFEVYNPSASITYNLQGCDISDNANVHVINRALVVRPHQFITLGLFSMADGLMGGGFMPDYTYTSVKFNNDASDSVSIACNGALIDKFTYSMADASTSGRSFSVDPAHYDAAENDTPGNYCLSLVSYREATSGETIIRDYGTPGATNPPCP